MEILSASQVRALDQFTIAQTPIASIDLMERAARKCFEWVVNNVSRTTSVHLICGPGNNGGDGLALARMLKVDGYDVKISLLQIKNELSPDCKTNLERLREVDNNLVTVLKTDSEVPAFEPGSFLIDAIFGTGFSGITEGLVARIIKIMNETNLPILSIDLPSGINSDKTSLLTGNEIIKATYTLTFQYLKLAMLVGENAPFLGAVKVLDIGLLKEGLATMEIKNFQTDHSLLTSIYVPKREFSHKGNYGHSLLITGGEGKMGAAILAARGYLKSGAALLTLFVPQAGIPIIQESVPEAMALYYSETRRALPNIDDFKVTGAGPGMGTGKIATEIIDRLLDYNLPMVLDADALNIISQNPGWLKRVCEGTILTPHPGEFRRLAGEWQNDFEKLEMQRQLASSHKIYVVLKGKNTSVACPDGTLWFNPTGNAGMAKGGSGDILTGLLTGLLASGYSTFETCILGTWLHGLAGDLAADLYTQEAMNASDTIDQLPQAWKNLIALKS